MDSANAAALFKGIVYLQGAALGEELPLGVALHLCSCNTLWVSFSLCNGGQHADTELPRGDILSPSDTQPLAMMGIAADPMLACRCTAH